MIVLGALLTISVIVIWIVYIVFGLKSFGGDCPYPETRWNGAESVMGLLYYRECSCELLPDGLSATLLGMGTCSPFDPMGNGFYTLSNKRIKHTDGTSALLARCTQCVALARFDLSEETRRKLWSQQGIHGNGFSFANNKQ